MANLITTTGIVPRLATKAAKAVKAFIDGDSGATGNGDSAGLADYYANVVLLTNPASPQDLVANRALPVCGLFGILSYNPEICVGRLSVSVLHQIAWEEPITSKDDNDATIMDVVARHGELVLTDGNKTLSGLVDVPRDITDFTIGTFETDDERAYNYVEFEVLYEAQVALSNWTVRL